MYFNINIEVYQLLSTIPFFFQFTLILMMIVVYFWLTLPHTSGMLSWRRLAVWEAQFGRRTPSDVGRRFGVILGASYQRRLSLQSEPLSTPLPTSTQRILLPKSKMNKK